MFCINYKKIFDNKNIHLQPTDLLSINQIQPLSKKKTFSLLLLLVFLYL